LINIINNLFLASVFHLLSVISLIELFVIEYPSSSNRLYKISHLSNISVYLIILLIINRNYSVIFYIIKYNMKIHLHFDYNLFKIRRKC